MSTEVKYYRIDNPEDNIRDVIANEDPNDSVFLLESNYRRIGDFLMAMMTYLDLAPEGEENWIVYGGEEIPLSREALGDLLLGFSGKFFDNLSDYLKEYYEGDNAAELLKIIENVRAIAWKGITGINFPDVLEIRTIREKVQKLKAGGKL